MHALDGAYLRVQRAATHLADLERRAKRFSDSHKNNLTYEFNPETQRAEVWWSKGRAPRQSLSILVGEIIYNLRAALDYLAFELSAHDCPPGHDKTQFPIDFKPAAFKGHRNSYLRGVSHRHVAAIEALQPYNGCKWTGTLANISNPDKHRKLTDSRGTADIVVRLSYGQMAKFVGPRYPRPGKIYPAQGRRRGKVYDVYVQADGEVEIEFADRAPVIPTLKAPSGSRQRDARCVQA